MSVQEAAVSLRQKVMCDIGIDWAADTHAVCVMDANGRIRAQFMIGHADDPAGAQPDLETGGQDVGQHDRGLVGHTVGHTVGQRVQGVLGEGPRHVIGLGAVDEVAQDPADARGALVVPFVPEDPAVGHRGHVTLEDVQVGAADRGGVLSPLRGTATA